MTSLSMPHTGTPKRSVSLTILRGTVIILIAAVAINFIVTLRGGLNRDDDAYIVMAKAMAAGRPLYKTVVDHSPPGIAFAAVPFIWVFGNTSALPARAADVFYALMRVAALIFIMRYFKQSRWAVMIVGLLAAMYAQMYDGINPSAISASLTVMALATSLFAFRKSSLSRYGLLILGGAIFGLAAWTKPSVVIEGLALLGIFYVSQPAGQRYLRDYIAFIFGSLLFCAFVILYFSLTGDLYEMLYVSIGMNFGYIGFNPFNLELTGKPQSQLDFISTYFLPQTVPFYAPLIIFGTISFVWHWCHQRSSLISVFMLWAILAFLHGLLGIALHVRYFSHSIAPLALLAGFSFEERFRTGLLRLSFIISAPLLLYYFLLPPPPVHTPFLASDYAADKQMLDQTLQKGDCLLTWGWLAPLSYYTDYPTCNRIQIEGNMMRPELFDMRLMRTWYFEDIFTQRPPILVRQNIWQFFPELQRLMDYRIMDKSFFHNPSLKADYYRLNWSTFHEVKGTVNNEIELLGYDIKPDLKATDGLPPGQTFKLTMYWNVLKQPSYDYQGFVQITPNDFGSKVVGVDLPPSDPVRSTLTWNRPGEIIIGRTYELTLPSDVKPGEYKLVAGMYGFQNNQAVSVSHTDNTGNSMPFIILRSINVKAD